MTLFPFATSPRQPGISLTLAPELGPEFDPFLPVSDGDATSRVLLAHLKVAAAQDSVVLFGLKLRRNHYRFPYSPGRQLYQSNELIDAAWAAESAALSSFPNDLGGALPGFAALLQFGAFPPVLYCADSGVYFHPPCPTCARPLRTCKDNTLLLSAGLESYAGSQERFLFCESCCKSAREPEELTFWRFSDEQYEPAGVRARVRVGSQLHDDFWPLLQKAAKGTLDADSLTALELCLPELASIPKLVKDKLAPVSFYDSELLPIQLGDATFDEANVLLGGGQFADLSVGRGVLLPGREKGQKALKQSLAAKRFFFEDDESGLFPLECLLLKLQYLKRIVELTGMLHKSGRPHLGLTPAQIMLRIPDTLGVGPVNWTMRPFITGLGYTQPYRTDEMAGSNQPVFLPPWDVDPVYGAPPMRNEQFGKGEIAHVMLRSLEPQSATDGLHAVRVEFDLIGHALRARKPAPNDLISVKLPLAGRAAGMLVLSGNPQEEIDGGIRCHATTVPLDRAAVAMLEGMVNRLVYDREIIHYRSFHAPCDIHSLGMLLFRALLVHDGQDVLAVSEALGHIVSKVELSLPRGATPDPQILEAQFLQFIRDDNRTFHRTAVMHRRDRRGQFRNSIPVDVWESLLLLGCRMITTYPGFSICDRWGQFDPAQPDDAAQRVLAELEQHTDRLWGELFGSQPMNRDILKLLDEIEERADRGGVSSSSNLEA